MKSTEVNLNFFYGFKCNYSCVGCATGSNAVSEHCLDPDLNKTIQTIKKSSQLFNVSSMVTLIGGEPFLYWDTRIVPLALTVNEYFPKTRINITTNGQLLGKNVEKIFELSNQIDELSITITKHLVNITDLKVKRLWEENMDSFLSNDLIVKIHDNHYHIKDNIHANIYFFEPEMWKSYYYYTADKKIKPWATNDPENSMKYGCTGSVCSTFFENRLYKCFTLATLSQHLESLGQKDDPSWQKYLNYPFVDIDNIDNELLNTHVENYGKPVTYCDMCTNTNAKNTPWKERTFPLIFSKHKMI